jgi:hypothetical protein
MKEATTSTEQRVNSGTSRPAVPAPPGSKVVWAGAFARIGSAATLLIAAVLKVYQLATDPALGVLYGSRWLQAGLIEYELLLALWLLSGFAVPWARRVALVTFLAFASYSLYLGLSGTASCGCFGKARVSPWWTFLLDAVLVFLLLSSKTLRRRTASDSASPPARPARVPASLAILVTLLLTSVFIVSVAPWRPRSASTDSSLADNSFVLLEPEKWIGKPFPLTDHIDMDDHEALSHGSWIILFYHDECPKCRRAVRLYERQAENLSRAGEAVQVALVTVPPIRAGELTFSPHCRIGRLREGKQWLIATPAEVRLTDGQVIAATSEEDSLLAGLRSGTHQP